MAAVVVNTDDTAVPLGCVLPCPISQATEPKEKPMTDKDMDARCLKTTAVERSRDTVTVHPRVASANPPARDEK